MGTKFFTAVGVLPVELFPYQVSMVSAKKLTEVGLFINLMLNWVDKMMLSVLSFAYFT